MTLLLLPPHASLEHLRNQAKTLLHDYLSGDKDAIARIGGVYGADAQRSAPLRLANAQFVIAHEYGFASWTRLKTHVQALAEVDTPSHDIKRGDAVYRRMLDSIRSAKSITAEICITISSNGTVLTTTGSRLQIRKPNQAHIETWIGASETEAHLRTICIADGQQFWCYWPNGRVKGDIDKSLPLEQNLAFGQYLCRPAPTGLDTGDREIIMSVGASTPGVSLRVLHGGADRVWPKGGSPRWVGLEEVDGEPCDVVEIAGTDVTWKLWTAERDGILRRHLRRQEHETVLDLEAAWTGVTLNTELPDNVFQWQPPAEWTQWSYPAEGEKLIRPGVPAPDFELGGLRGETLRLSDYRGQVLALALGWSCRQDSSAKEADLFQRLHEEFAPRGAAIVVVTNFGDTKNGLLSFFADRRADFPCVHEQIFRLLHAYGAIGPMAFVLVGRDGRVIDSWVRDIGRLEPAIAKAVAAG